MRAARPHSRILVFLLFLPLLFIVPGPRAADQRATYTRYCSTCGLRDVETFLSQSGQFVVHGPTVKGFIPRAMGTNASAFITAEPQLVALMADRVSRALTAELHLAGSFRDKVHVTVFNVFTPGQVLGLVTQVHTDGFLYKLSVPAQVEGQKLFKGLMQVLLMEYAHRGSKRTGEMPNWMVEGMVRQLQTRVVPAYVVNRQPITIETAGYDRLGATRGYLQTNAPMTLQELSFADLTRVTPEQREQFEASAHLLVHQLLKLKNGPQLMARFLQTLPQTLNWQTAFYAAYKQHFAGPLDFEKWWMLNWVEFRNSQEKELWTLESAVERLESVLQTPMEVRMDANSVPRLREASLQEFLQLADHATQKEILTQKVQQLFFLSMNAPPAVNQVWGAYQRTIENYVQRRGNEEQPTLRMQALVRETISTLNELDAARAELKAGRVPVLSQALRDLTRQARR